MGRRKHRGDVGEYVTLLNLLTGGSLAAVLIATLGISPLLTLPAVILLCALMICTLPFPTLSGLRREPERLPMEQEELPRIVEEGAGTP